MSNETMTLKVIAHIHTAFPTKFGIPRQSGLVNGLRGEWGFVDAENLRAEAGEHPCPAAGGRTQIKAQIAGAGAFGQQGEGFPEFEVGPAWRIDLVFMELHHAVGERRRAPGRSEDEVGLPQCP